MKSLFFLFVLLIALTACRKEQPAAPEVPKNRHYVRYRVFGTDSSASLEYKIGEGTVKRISSLTFDNLKVLDDSFSFESGDTAFLKLVTPGKKTPPYAIVIKSLNQSQEGERKMDSSWIQMIVP